MPPMFDRLRNLPRLNYALLVSIKAILAKVPSTDVLELAETVGDHGSIKISHENAEELVVDFRLGPRTVHMMQCLDIDLDNAKPFDETKRNCEGERRAEAAFDEPPKSTTLQQQFMATTDLAMKDNNSSSAGPMQSTEGYEDELRDMAVLEELRSEAQERFWLHLSRDERDQIQQNTSSQGNQTRVQTSPISKRIGPKDGITARAMSTTSTTT